MAFTLLIDLDDTLLFTNLQEFIQAYFHVLTEHMAGYDLPASFTGVLMNSTRKMLENENPAMTLAEVFREDFFPALKAILPPAMQTAGQDLPFADHPVTKAINEFYRDVFPSLRSVTRTNPDSVELIQAAQKRDYRIAIATNPLFPRTATMQRLAWAGIPHDDFSFELVSTYEDFHFTKPKPAYYAEVLAQMGWPEGPVVMVGNELQDDIEGAMRLGLCTYWAKPDGRSLSRLQLGEAAVAPCGSGDLNELLDWIDQQQEVSLNPRYLKTNESILAVLYSTPAALATITKRFGSGDVWRRLPRPESWGAAEICCHLRDIERDIFLPRIRRTLTENNPSLEDITAAEWAAERDYLRQGGAAALREFIQARQETSAMLKDISESDWSRPAVHPKYGQVTLFFLAQRVALHDQDHIRQLKSALLEEC